MMGILGGRAAPARAQDEAARPAGLDRDLLRVSGSVAELEEFTPCLTRFRVGLPRSEAPSRTGELGGQRLAQIELGKKEQRAANAGQRSALLARLLSAF